MRARRRLPRRLIAAGCAGAIAFMSTMVAAQYALDRNQRINTQVSGVGYQRNANFGQRNLYAPGITTAASPYTLNRNTGEVVYNPNQAFGRPLYQPTGYALAGGTPGYQSRFRY